jgi:hypothetical protein
VKKRINITLNSYLHEKCSRLTGNLSQLIEDLLEKHVADSIVSVAEEPAEYYVKSNIEYELKDSMAFQVFQQLKGQPQKLQSEVLNYVKYLLSQEATNTRFKNRLEPGLLKGQIKMSDDFNDSISDFDTYL